MNEPFATTSPSLPIAQKVPTTPKRTRSLFSSAGLISVDKRGEERFWSKVQKGPNCWEYQGSRFTEGYGQFTFRRDEVGPGAPTQVGAHRVAFYLVNGPFTGDVLHSCDNPPCVNPDHLHLGTPKVNSTEAAERGRYPNQNKLWCPQGHPYNEENTRWAKRGDRRFRRCRACNQAQGTAIRRRAGQIPRVEYLATVRRS